MNSFKIFQIEKNNEDIRKTVLTNLIKMLTERKLLQSENFDENIKNILNVVPDDLTYKIKLDSEKQETIIVRIIPQKITSISKQSNINEFLNAFYDSHKIVIVKGISTKAHQYIINNYNRTEIFLEEFLMINLIDHQFVPRYELIDHETDDFKKFCQIYQCKKRNIHKLLINDPVTKYYNLKKGDIVRIIRPSETTGYSASYRLVV